MSEPIAAPRSAPLELKLRIMFRNWSYPEFREVLYGEARESKDHKYTNIYKRLYAYLRTLELRQQGLGYNEIRRAINNEVGYAPMKHMLSRWLTGRRTPIGRMGVFDVRCPEVGLVMGMILSDGYRGQCYSHGYIGDRRGEFYNKDEGIMEEFREACRRLGLAVNEGLIPPRLGGECQKLTISSTLLYLLLKRYDEFIIRAPAEVQLSFLRGLWLGDGCLSNCTFHNTDVRIVNTVSELLRVHKVKHTVEGPYPQRSGQGRKPLYVVYVRSCSRGRFLRLTGLIKSPSR